MLSAITFTTCNELTSSDVIMTVGADSMEMYGSRLVELNQECGEFTTVNAAATMARHLHGAGIDTSRNRRTTTTIETCNGGSPSGSPLVCCWNGRIVASHAASVAPWAHDKDHGTRDDVIGRVNGLLDSNQGILLVGDLGIGKSHVARQIADQRTHDYVEVLIGSPAIQGISFGAAAHLVPDRAVADPLRLLQLARRSLEERAGTQDLVLIVDDLDKLDAGTLALIHQLAVGGRAAVLATVRESQVSIPAVAAFWEDEHLMRLDLGPLTRREHDDMVADLAGTPVPFGLGERIWELTQGNPLFAREVVLALAGDGVLQPEVPVSEALLESTRLRHYLGHRLEGLSEDERRIVASIALTEPLDASVVHHLFDAATVETVHLHHLVLTEHTEDRPVYRTSHPLLSELVRAALAPVTRDQLLADVVDASLEEAGEHPATDLRIASWLLEAGLPVDADLAFRATQAAQQVFDGETAVRLSAAALASGPSFERLLAHGMALSLVGRVDEADRNLAEAETLTRDEATIGATTVARAINLMHRGGEAERAVDLLRQRSGELSDPSARANIESMLMQGEGLQGDFRRALDIGPQLAAATRNGDIAELRLLVSLTVARVVTGRLDNAGEELDRGLDVARHLADQYPVEADQMMLNEVLFEMTRPDLKAAIRLIAERLGSQSGAGEGPWFYIAGWVLSAIGDLPRARRPRWQASSVSPLSTRSGFGC